MGPHVICSSFKTLTAVNCRHVPFAFFPTAGGYSMGPNDVWQAVTKQDPKRLGWEQAAGCLLLHTLTEPDKWKQQPYYWKTNAWRSSIYIYKKNQTNNQKNLMPQRTMGTRSMGASRKREVDSELNKEGVVEVREVVKRIEQFNHNHLGWITGARSTRLKIARERERD